MRTKKHPVEKRIAPVQFFRKAALCKALTRNREKFLQLFAGVFLLNISGDERLFLTNRRPRQRARRRRFAGLPGTSQANEKTNCPFFRSSAHPLIRSSAHPLIRSSAHPLIRSPAYLLQLAFCNLSGIFRGSRSWSCLGTGAFRSTRGGGR